MPKPEIPLETLLHHLHGSDWTARCDAPRLLGQSRDPGAAEALLPDLNDPDWRVRRNAAQALGALRDKRAIGPLLEALNDRTLTVRQRAIVALGRIKDVQALPALLDILLQERRESYDAKKAIRKLGKKALPELVKAFEQTDNPQLMLLLIEMRYAGTFELLVRLLKGPDPSTAETAIREMGNLGDKRAIPYLLPFLNSDDPARQAEAVYALGKLGATASIPMMLALLKDPELYGPHSGIYHAVTEAFQLFGGVTPEIKNAFPGNYPAMFNVSGAPISLAEAIGLFGNDQSRLLGEALSRLQDGAPKAVEMPGIPPEILNKAFDDLAWKFGVMFADARDASQERVRRLMELLHSGSSLTRAAAALSLPWYADARSLAALEQATRDPEETVRVATTWAFHALQKVLLYRKQAGL
jgi:HEAT repeat protein